MNAFARARKQVQLPIFLPPVIILLSIIIWGAVDLKGFGEVSQAVIVYIRTTFASGFMLTGFLAVLFLSVICCTSAGSIRIGGKNAKPEFSLTNWFSMSICACIAIGILFWGVAEPMYHWMTPPKGLGINPSSPEAAVFSLRKTNLHWCITPFALQMVFGVGVAYLLISRNKPIQPRYILSPILNDKILDGGVGKGIDALFIFSYVAAISPSLVFGAQQIAGGLNYWLGIPNSIATCFMVVVAITVTYTVSSCTGIKKGIKTLSSFNYWMYIFLLCFIFAFGPTKFISDIFTQGLGEYIQNFVGDSLFTDPMDKTGGWVGGWTSFYWCWWVTAGPVTGAFVARISVGRTLRQMILMYVGIGSIFSAIWMATFGGSAIYFDAFKDAGIWAIMSDKGVEVAAYSFLGNLPLAAVTIPVFLLACYISFTTNVDSGTTTLAYMTCGLSAEDGEPPLLIKIVWGSLLGGVGIVLLALDSMKATQSLAVATGFFVSILLVACICAISKALIKEMADS